MRGNFDIESALLTDMAQQAAATLAVSAVLETAPELPHWTAPATILSGASGPPE